MNLSALLDFARAVAGEKSARAEGDCSPCAFFRRDPALIEAEIAGLAIMSSAHASVCGTDGLCTRQQCVINGRRRCAEFRSL